MDVAVIPATSARVMNLWSAGMTHHGAQSVLVFCSTSANAAW